MLLFTIYCSHAQDGSRVKAYMERRVEFLDSWASFI